VFNHWRLSLYREKASYKTFYVEEGQALLLSMELNQALWGFCPAPICHGGGGGGGGGEADFPELKFRERFHYDKEHENLILKRFTDLSLLVQIHGYLLDLK
jgi:hypothetical protein